MPKKKRGKTRATKMAAGDLGQVGHSDIDLYALQQSLRDAVTVMAPRGSAHHAESEELADELRPAAHRVCRHMLDGGCFRSDCPFSHDVSGVPCRYFGTPMGCRNGPSCQFLHHESAIRTPAGPATTGSSMQLPQAAASKQQLNQAQIMPPGFGSWPSQASEQIGAQWDFVSGVTPLPQSKATHLPGTHSLPTLPHTSVDWSRAVSTPTAHGSEGEPAVSALSAAMAAAAESSRPWDGPPSAAAVASTTPQAQWGQPSSSQNTSMPAWGSPSAPSSSTASKVAGGGEKPGDSSTFGWADTPDTTDELTLGEEDNLPFEGDDLDWLLQMASDATDAAHAARHGGGSEGEDTIPASQCAPVEPIQAAQHVHKPGRVQRPARIFLGPIPPWVVQDLEDMEGGSKVPLPTAADFPSLGGGKIATVSSGTPTAKAAAGGEGGGSAWSSGGESGSNADDARLNLSDRLKLQWLVDAVADGIKQGGINDPRRGDASVVLEAFLDSGRDLDAARQALQQHLNISIAVQRADKVQAETYARYEQFAGGTAGMTSAARRAAAAAAKRLKWVDTGVGVNATYKSARGDAERFAVARNKCFGRATEAYLGGKGAAARGWSKEGRTWDAKMRQAHARAAATIFAQRNAAMGGNDGLLSVDVHGLHPDEAVQVTQDAMRNAGEAQWLAVIMGTGHHSISSRSVLVEELKRWAERSHVSWFEGGSGAGQGGVMMIQLAR